MTLKIPINKIKLTNKTMTDLTNAHKALTAFKTLNELDVLSPDQQRDIYQSIENKFGKLPYNINYPKPQPKYVRR